MQRARRRALWLGLAALAVYVAGAFISGMLDPRDRRPILDGAPTPAYRWVAPPPELAASNQPPTAGDFHIAFEGEQSKAGVFSTNDQQASVAVLAGAFPFKEGVTGVHLLILPLDPATLTAPREFEPAGNVYQFEATYEPSAEPIPSIGGSPQLSLTYPAIAVASVRRAVLISPDGAGWQPLQTKDDRIHLTATAVGESSLGYFMVATSETGSPSPGGARGGGMPAFVFVVIGAAALAAAFLVLLRLQARRRSQAFSHPTKGPTPAAAPSRPPARPEALTEGQQSPSLRSRAKAQPGSSAGQQRLSKGQAQPSIGAHQRSAASRKRKKKRR